MIKSHQENLLMGSWVCETLRGKKTVDRQLIGDHFIQKELVKKIECWDRQKLKGTL